LLTSAIPALEELQVTDVVRSCVVPSEKTPVAVNCAFVPLAMEEPVGVTVIELRVAAVTVTVVEPVTPA
jgi:hypothetical protein